MKPISIAVVGLGVLGLLGTAAAPAKAQDWKQEWDKTVAGAKKEGRLVVYMRRYDQIFETFNKKYPGIKTVKITGRGSKIGARILAEHRAGKYLADIYIGGPYTSASMLIPGKVLDPISDVLFLPEVTDGKNWVTGKIRYSDPTRKYNIAFLANPGSGQISYNTKMVKDSDLKSYKDLLDPKWNGKILALDPTQRFIGGTTQFMFFHPELGPDYFRKFWGNKSVTFAGNNRQMTDWLASGKYAICIGCLHVEKAMEQGLPLGIFNTVDWREGASFQAGSGAISLIKNAPHPNAAKLFINWFLSREGQIALQKISDRGTHHNSGRVDIPKSDVSPENRLADGRKYFDQNSPEWSNIRAMLKVAKKIVADRKK
jgi:iron(III) transport system substrate-binding protein